MPTGEWSVYHDREEQMLLLRDVSGQERKRREDTRYSFVCVAYILMQICFWWVLVRLLATDPYCACILFGAFGKRLYEALDRTCLLSIMQNRCTINISSNVHQWKTHCHCTTLVLHIAYIGYKMYPVYKVVPFRARILNWFVLNTCQILTASGFQDAHAPTM